MDLSGPAARRELTFLNWGGSLLEVLERLRADPVNGGGMCVRGLGGGGPQAVMFDGSLSKGLCTSRVSGARRQHTSLKLDRIGVQVAVSLGAITITRDTRGGGGGTRLLNKGSTDASWDWEPVGRRWAEVCYVV